MKHPVRALIAATLLLAATPTLAGIKFSQGSFSPAGVISDFAKAFGINQQADNFSLAVDSPISALLFWGSYGSGASTPGSEPADDFTIRFFADNGSGDPATTPDIQLTGLTVQRQDTGVATTSGSNVFRYSVDLSAEALSFAPSTTYYLSVVNNTTSTTAWAWSYSNSGLDDTRWSRGTNVSDNQAWNRQSNEPEQNEDLAFQLAVPAPGPLALMAIGGAALLGVTRRRRRADTLSSPTPTSACMRRTRTGPSPR